MTCEIGFSNLLLDTELNDDQRHMLRAIQTSSQNLLGVINDILDFSQIENGTMRLRAKVFNLHHLVQSTCESVTPALVAKSLDLVHIHEGSTRLLEGDAGRIRQCMLNLVTNATKFSSDNIIIIRTVLSEEVEEARLALLTISIRDR